MPDINETLAERGSRYADFRDNAIVAQDIKQVFRDSPNWNSLPGYMQEGLDMFASKISRMLTGDMLYDDNIHDIIGYAKLMQDRMAEDRVNPPPLMPDAVTLPEMKPVEPLELPTLDLGDFKEKMAPGYCDAEFLLERVMELGFTDALGFALALLGCAGFRVNDDGSIVNDAGETPDVVYLDHFHKGKPPVVDGSAVPNPSFFRDGVRDVLTRGNEARPLQPAAPPTDEPAVDASETLSQLRQDMWDDHKGRVAWGYTTSKAVAEEFDTLHPKVDGGSEQTDWLQENVLAGNVDLYAMRQQDVDGIYCLGAFEIPKK